MIGRDLAHYHITGRLGAGGMGEVYRATDTKLGRDVALKVLPAAMSDDADRLFRFQREAKSIAALNHPNIVTLYSVEHAGSVHFLTMELVEGRTLDRVLPADGVPLAELFELAMPIADALASAHARGIVHRDLKPANVMVTHEGGRVKVLDFGLAKLVETDQDADLGEATKTGTAAGLILGTPYYMSPEQARGGMVDHRSDVFSLGVLLFELATGRRPFQGASSIELLSAVLKDPAPTLEEVRPELPRHLGRVIERCLEKAPIDRYQTARDVYNELRVLKKETTSAARPSSSRPSPSDSAFRRSRAEAPWIAVMPLQAQSADQELTDFADGLTEDITTGLSRFSYLLVISRNSARKLQGHAVDVRQIGRELGARFVLEGSVRKGGSKIRVSLQVVDAGTGTHLWAETFDRNLREQDIFEVQDEITERVVSTVADPYGVLIRSMATPTGSKPPETLTPYEAVLRFFLYQQRVSVADHLTARTALERAVDEEPGYADAWASLAICLLDEHRHAFNSRPGALERALQAARRGVDADPANQLANYALAQVHYFRRDFSAFRTAADRAIGLNTRDGNTMAMLGILAGYGGDWSRGMELTTRAMALNPHHPGWYRFTSVFNAYRQRRYAEALEAVQQINMPDYFPTYYTAAMAHAQLGHDAEAREAAARTVELWPDFERGFLTDHIEKWISNQPDLVEHILDGLERAGLRVRGADAAAPRREAGSPQAAPARSQASVAVLPFASLSPDRDDEYFADGIAEEILNALVQIPELKVAARTSAFSFRGDAGDLRVLGEKLGVGAVLRGSVRRAGHRLRISVQLVGVDDGFTLWSERYDRDLADVFAVQDEIARNIAARLEVTLGGAGGQAPRGAAATLGTSNVEAYEHYLKGRYLWYQRTPASLQGAAECFEQAIALDPRFASAHAGLSDTRSIQRVFAYVSWHATHESAATAARRATELAPDSPETHVTLAYHASYYGNDYPGAESHWRRALELDPRSALAHSQYATHLAAHGRHDEAYDHIARGRKLDPLSPHLVSMAGLAQLLLGRFDDAIASSDAALELYEDFPMALWVSGMALSRSGRHADAVDRLEKSAAMTHRNVMYAGTLGQACARAGDPAAALAVLDEFARRSGAGEYVSPAGPLFAYVGLGDWDGVERVLEAALEDHMPPIVLCLAIDEIPREPRPRLAELLTLLRYPRWQQTVGPSSGPRTQASRPTRQPFVGREAERARLDAMLDEAAGGRGGLVLLAGEPGVGKTRLASEIMEDGLERGMLALAGHAYEDRTAPFVTASEILEEMVRLVPAADLRRMLGPDGSELSRLLPALRHRYPDIPEPLEVPPQQQQRHLFRSVVEFLSRAARDRPMVILLDDVHWADESSLLLLEYVARRLRELPILMIATYRDAPSEMSATFAKTMAVLVRQRLAERMPVSELGESAVTELLAALGGSRPPLGLARAIQHGTEGNAFFVEEVFRHLSEEGALFDERGRWRPDLDVEALDVPEGVRLVTGRRLDRLRAETVTVLRTAAAIGLRFDLRVLDEASADADAVLDAIEEAERARLLRPVASDAVDVRYEFSHALVRQTLLDALSRPRRQRLHLRLADAIERVCGTRLERRVAEQAYHLVQAGSTAPAERARRVLSLAGDAALAAAAPDEAIGFYEKALSLDGGLASSERAGLLLKRGDASRALGRWDEAAADWQEAVPVLQAEGRTDVVARLYWELAYQRMWQNRLDEARAIATRGLEAAGPQPSVGRCRLLAVLAHAETNSLNLDRGDALFNEATAMAEALGGERVLVSEVLLARMFQYEHVLKPARMAEVAERAMALAREARPWERSSALGTSILAWWFTGQIERMREQAVETEALATQEGDTGSVLHAVVGLALAGLAQGDLAGAREGFRKADALCVEAGFPWWSFMRSMGGWTAMALGDWSTARREMEEAAASALEGTFQGCEAGYLLRCLAYAGDERAVVMLHDLASRLPAVGATSSVGSWIVLLASVESAAVLGQRDHAAALYPAVRQLLDEGGVVAFTDGLVERQAGIAAAAARDWPAADAHFARALRQADELPHRSEQPEVRRWQAWMLIDRAGPGDVERARVLLNEAVALYAAIGMPRHVAIAQAMRRRI